MYRIDFHNEGRTAAAVSGRAAKRLRGGPKRVTLILVVEERDILRVRKAVIQSGNEHIEILRCMPVRGASKVRMAITLDPSTLDDTVLRIMRAIGSGEFGQVRVSSFEFAPGDRHERSLTPRLIR
jgi:hypothetical protein